MHTILGANGAIANGIAAELNYNQITTRLVSRNPKKQFENNQILSADLLNAQQVMEAVKGSEVVYLTPGLTYNSKIWQEQWPKIMSNVVNACKEHEAKLLFFDNVYAYGRVDGWMTENTPLNPNSKKGEVRAKLVEMLMKEMRNGLPVIISRSADFYGSASPFSFMNVLVFENIAKGKKPMLMLNPNAKHSLSYIPDAGKGTAMLGMATDTWNQTWHVPTAADPLTGAEAVAMAADIAGFHSKKYTLLAKWMLQAYGMFNPIIRESIEMLYQSKYDYLFDSTKFNNHFNYTPVSYRQGIKETLESYRKQ